jgi:peptidoglycan/xylan/chitin deacetylase (PgdA/CDA1 family)
MKGNFKVLVYHKVEDEKNFRRQLVYLKKNYNVIDLIILKKYCEKRSALPEKALLITFDDGDYTNFSKAYPLLKLYKIPAIFFVVTGLLNSETPFWWDELIYYLGSKEGNQKAWEVKTWSNRERVKFLENVRKTSEKPKLKSRQLAVSELEELKQENIAIANHTFSHPMLDRCSEEEIDWELSTSILTLQNLDCNGDVFAYPNGNWTPFVEKKLKQHNIKLSFLFDHQINKANFNPLRISRLVVDDSTPYWKFRLILSGLHSKILPFSRAMNNMKNIK